MLSNGFSMTSSRSPALTSSMIKTPFPAPCINDSLISKPTLKVTGPLMALQAAFVASRRIVRRKNEPIVRFHREPMREKHEPIATCDEEAYRERSLRHRGYGARSKWPDRELRLAGFGGVI